ncbi:MAG: AI-2E family transporter [Sphaerochaeta sp.]
MNESPPVGNRYIHIMLGIIVTLAVLAALKISKDVTIPLVLAFFFFLMFSPLLRRLDKLHVPKLFSTIFIMVLMLLLLLAAGWFIIKTVDTLVRLIPFYADKIVSLDRLLTGFASNFVEIPPSTSLLSLLPVNWSNLAISSLTQISNKFFSITKVALLVYIFFLFLLLERQSVIPKLLAAVPQGKGMKVAVMFERITRQISKYLLLKIVISFFTGLLFYLTALLTGLDLPSLWGVLAFVFNFIPSIGSVFVTLLTIFMALVQFAPNWTNVMYVALLTISTQMILGNIIDPRLQGGQLNLSPFMILVSLSLWGYIWGIVGMFIAVPLTSVMQILFANIKSLRPFAIMISSGKSYQRERARQKTLRNYERRTKGQRSVESTGEESESSSSEDSMAKESVNMGDFVLPEQFGEKK